MEAKAGGYERRTRGNWASFCRSRFAPSLVSLLPRVARRPRRGALRAATRRKRSGERVERVVKERHEMGTRTRASPLHHFIWLGSVLVPPARSAPSRADNPRNPPHPRPSPSRLRSTGLRPLASRVKRSRLRLGLSGWGESMEGEHAAEWRSGVMASVNP